MTSLASDPSRPPRVTRLRVSNYRSLGDDVQVDFGQFTALVGPNGSGKSNVLDVFRFLREALTLGLEPAISKRLGITRLRRVAPTKPRALKIAVELVAAEWSASYELQLSASTGRSYRVEHEELNVVPAGESKGALLLSVDRGRVRDAPAGLSPRGTDTELVLPTLAGDSAIQPVVEALRGIRVHSIYPRELSQPQPIGAGPPLEDNGSNWCAVLKTMDQVAHRELTVGLERVTGDITGVRVDSAGGYYTPEFEHRLAGTKRWFSAGQESDGTLRMAGILTALLQRPAPPMVGIEEPELTINPGLLPLLYDYLKATSERCQVVITTHSPDLVNMLRIDDMRVVERINGVSRVGTVAESQRTMVQESLMSPGDILRDGGFRTGEEGRSLLEIAGDET